MIQINDDAWGISDFWNDVPSTVKQAINQAKEELDNGEGIPHSQIMSETKARFLDVQ